MHLAYSWLSWNQVNLVQSQRARLCAGAAEVSWQVHVRKTHARVQMPHVPGEALIASPLAMRPRLLLELHNDVLPSGHATANRTPILGFRRQSTAGVKYKLRCSGSFQDVTNEPGLGTTAGDLMQ
jgi:hypothetical protein